MFFLKEGIRALRFIHITTSICQWSGEGNGKKEKTTCKSIERWTGNRNNKMISFFIGRQPPAITSGLNRVKNDYLLPYMAQNDVLTQYCTQDISSMIHFVYLNSHLRIPISFPARKVRCIMSFAIAITSRLTARTFS